MKAKLFGIAVFLAIAGQVAFRVVDDDLVTRLQEGLRQYAGLFPEKIYVHTDKPYYTTGEIIWFKAYLVNALTHEPLETSKLAYVELINPQDEIVMRRYIRIENGGGAGDFGLEPELPSGNYRLRAYSSHMRNFGSEYLFEMPLTIWNQDIAPADAPALNTVAGAAATMPPRSPTGIHVGFYPEGGDLVYGLASQVAFKAVGPDGRGADVQGRVVDQAGNEVTTFKTQGMGMGVFPLTPEPGKQYQALVQANGQEMGYPLPEPLEEGYVLKVSPRPGDKVALTVTATPGLSVQDVVVVAHLRGLLRGTIRAQEGATDSFTGVLSTADAPDGIFTLTLFTKEGEPLAERLYFVDNPGKGAQLTMKPDQESYGNRENVNLAFQLRDPEGNPLAANLSMTVTDRSLVDRQDDAGDLRTYLLLNSDLQGYIENPNYYFENDDPARAYLLNLLMMTQGWRRFTWKEILSEEKRPLEYPLEQGFTVRGKLTQLNSEKPVQGLVWLNAYNQEDLVSVRFLTLEDGNFGFNNVQIMDTTEVIVQARIPNKKLLAKVADNADEIPENPTGNRNVSIQPNPVAPPAVEALNFILRGAYQDQAIRDYVAETQKIREVDSVYGGPSVLLETVVVTAQAPKRDRFDRPGKLYSTPSDRIIADSILKITQPLTVFDYLRYIPGVMVSGGGIYQGVTIRGGSNILYLLDGMPVDAMTIQSISVFDVDFIDVLKGPAASIYGGRAGDGVVAVYTRIGPREDVDVARGPGIANFTHPGYYKAREFYAPNYAERKAGQEKPDYRTTLYWNPAVTTDENGNAGVSFYTSDNRSDYDVIVQGVTPAGYLVSGRFAIETEQK